MHIPETDLSIVVNKIKQHIGINPVLISVAEHSAIDLEILVEVLNKNKIDFVGGIFPKVIYEKELYNEGLVINTLQNCEKIGVIKEISKQSFSIPEFTFDKGKDYTFVTYVDGLTAEISNYLNALYNNYGMQTHYFGGGAGSLSLEQKPCVFSKEGVFQDAAVYAIVSMRCSIGVKHGWEKVEGPFIVTSANGNTIKELNWENPFEVYKNIVEDHSKLKFRSDNFFDIAKGYPFGIVKESSNSLVVRDPLKSDENGDLICIGELENNMLVNILNGSKESLIHAAQEACLEATNNAKNPHKAILINCISRVLFLEDNFKDELEVINTALQSKYPSLNICGALTLGEISSSGEGFLELYNKTVVIGLFE